MSSVKKEVTSLVCNVRASLKEGKCAEESLCNALEELKTLLPDSTKAPSSKVLRDNHQEAKHLFTIEFYVGLSECLIEGYSSEWLQGGPNGRQLHQLFLDFFLQGDPESALTVLSSALQETKESLKAYRCINLLESLFGQNCLRRIFSNYCCLCASEICATASEKTSRASENTDTASEKADGASKETDSASEKIDTASEETDGASYNTNSASEKTQGVSEKADRGGTVQSLSDTERMLVQRSVPLVLAISSLPDLVTARLTSRDDSDFFYPQNYVPFIGREMASALRTVYSRLREEQSCSVSVLSALLGKLAIIGHGELLWLSLLKELEMMCVGDFLWQRVLQRMVSGVPDRCLEQVTTPLVSLASSPMTLRAVLGELPVARDRLRFTLTHKLLLVRYTNRPLMLQNIIGYLHQLKSTFVATFLKLLNAWCDGSSLKHRPLEQTVYISKAIMLCVAYLSRDPDLVTKDLKDSVVKTLVGGMSNYLDSSIVQVRQTGMVVGEALSGLVHSDEKRLEFAMERDELVDGLRALLLIPSYDDDQSGQYQDVAVGNEQPHENDVFKKEPSKPDVDNSKETKHASETLDSDDDEDDLTPYDSNPQSSNPVKRPVYLAQCMDGLLKSDDPEWFEQCLRCIEELIRKHPEVSEMAAEMCRVLLNLEDRYALPEFILLRHRAMVALVVLCPETTARYLTHEFYERNYNVRQRLDVLDVLSSAARELSKPDTSTGSNDTPSNEGGRVKPDEAHWSSVVQARIESKTRRFGKGVTRTRPTPVPSRFANVAGWFFYPLLSQFDKRESCLDLLGSDHILLQRLLGTIGVVVFCASNSPGISPMARALIEFTWCFRYHQQPGVRRAVLRAVALTTVAVPPFLLASDLCSEVADLREWLQEDVLVRETDGECRSLAAQILVALQSKLKQELQADSDS